MIESSTTDRTGVQHGCIGNPYPHEGADDAPRRVTRKLGVGDGDRIIGEFVDGKIILTRPEDIVKRTAGIFADYAKDGPVEIDRDRIWGEIAMEREERVLTQIAEKSDNYDSD